MTDNADTTPSGLSSLPEALAAAFAEEPPGTTLIARLGIALDEVGPERVRARMPVAGNTQPYGVLHGGASAALAETAANLAAILHAQRFGCLAVGIELTCTHHRSVRSGWVHATAEALSLGRTIASYQVTIVDDDGARVCSARLTCVLRRAD